MTREEMYEKFFINEDNIKFIEVKTVKDAIDTCYDDFESRVCRNCKHVLYIEETNEYMCNNQNICLGLIVDKDFGCNRFEKRKR